MTFDNTEQIYGSGFRKVAVRRWRWLVIITCNRESLFPLSLSRLMVVAFFVIIIIAKQHQFINRVWLSKQQAIAPVAIFDHCSTVGSKVCNFSLLLLPFAIISLLISFSLLLHVVASFFVLFPAPLCFCFFSFLCLSYVLLLVSFLIYLCFVCYLSVQLFNY